MDCQLESLETENRRLKGKHDELETNLTEEKEMVKYLHGVIKNYQQLLTQPETKRQPRSASLRKVHRSSSMRNHAGENNAEERFIKKFVEMKSVAQARKPSDRMHVLGTPSDTASFSHRTRHREDNIVVQNEADSEAGLVAGIVSETKTDASKLVYQSRGQQVSPRRRLDLQRAEEMYKERRQTVRARDVILRQMAEVLDGLKERTDKHQKSLESKGKHLTKMERRLEYLESIALGEESEWL